jgi:predicted DNA-binding helix-hairpin-helix protein
VETEHKILPDAAKYDASCPSSGGIGSTTGADICHACTPGGRCVALLEILLTNFCRYDCVYCPAIRNTWPAGRYQSPGNAAR